MLGLLAGLEMQQYFEYRCCFVCALPGLVRVSSGLLSLSLSSRDITSLPWTASLLDGG